MRRSISKGKCWEGFMLGLIILEPRRVSLEKKYSKLSKLSRLKGEREGEGET